jgi:hypothetical protein
MLLLYIRLVLLAQRPHALASNSSTCFKYSPNIHFKSLLTLHTPWNWIQHLLTIKEAKPRAVKDHRPLLLFGALSLSISIFIAKGCLLVRNLLSNIPFPLCEYPTIPLLYESPAALSLVGLLLGGTALLRQPFLSATQ